MPLAPAAKIAMLNALGGVAGFASLHTADPGTTGASEATGGSPAYARKAITWNTATAASNVGNLDNNANPTFDVAAGTYTHFGLWSAATGGTFYGGGSLSTSETYGAQGQYTLSDADVNLP